MFVDLTGVFCSLYIYCLSYNAMRKYTVICTATLPAYHSLSVSLIIHNLIKRIELFLLPVKKWIVSARISGAILKVQL